MPYGVTGEQEERRSSRNLATEGSLTHLVTAARRRYTPRVTQLHALLAESIHPTAHEAFAAAGVTVHTAPARKS